MRLLLINPRFPDSFWSFKWAMETVLPGRKAINPPLGLATLAALCPPGWDVSILDENVESLPAHPEADIIGICGMGVQFPRQRELLAFHRSQGYFVVAGGSHASLCPEDYETIADTVISGEAEYIWPSFCRDFERGEPRPLYRESGEVDLADSPVPRFDLLRADRYQTMSLQFSRGCPFRCEFCDIIVMFGRKPRTKPLENVGRELDALRALGVHNVFFVDDNLIGNKPRSKRLLEYLTRYQQDHDHRFEFGTEASLNLAQDEQLLALFRQAGFSWVFLGIESPDVASLEETLKFQNTRQDLLTSVRTIYAHGIDVLAGFIIGFDNDTVETFARQYRFIMDSGIQGAMIGLLQATPKTPLHERLEKAGRLIPSAASSDNSKLGSNVVPLRMSYDEMVEGYRQLHVRLFDDRGIAVRIRNKLRHLRNPVASLRYSLPATMSISWRFLIHGLRPGGITRWGLFLGSIPWFRPRLVPLVVESWIVGLAMRDYIDRHFQLGDVPVQEAQGYLRRLEKTLRRYLEAGSLEVSLKHTAGNVSLRLHGWLDRRFFARAARQLGKMLRKTRSSVTLHIDHLHAVQVQHFERFLRRLARHGDRIRITLHENLRGVVMVDSSVFDLSFES